MRVIKERKCIKKQRHRVAGQKKQTKNKERIKMKGGQDERKERRDGTMNSGGQRRERRGACRDQGGRNKAQPGGSNEREGLK